jgi:broad specificity phosphatase PhoE
VSPLTRARQTADIIAGAASSAAAVATATSSSDLSPVVLPSLREIDLYSFQGLLKAQVGQ